MPRLRKPVSVARVVCGSQPIALEISSIVIPHSCESISITCESLEFSRGGHDLGFESTLEEDPIDKASPDAILIPDAVNFRL